MSVVLVAGATGQLGSVVARLLAEAGNDVRGLVRSEEAAARLPGGVAAARGDLERPQTLAHGLAGVDVVVSTASAFPVDPRPDAIARVDRGGQLALVDAAVAAGVRRFVYMSFPPSEPDFPFQRAKRAVEERLGASGMEVVVLQPGKFMDVWFTPPLGLDLGARTARLYGGGVTPQSWVAVADVAAATAHGAVDPDWAGRTAVFGGPEALTQSQVVDALEELVGGPFARTVVPVEELEGMRRAPAPTVESLGAILLQATRPDVLPPVTGLPGVAAPGITVEAFLRGLVRG